MSLYTVLERLLTPLRTKEEEKDAARALILYIFRRKKKEKIYARLIF